MAEIQPGTLFGISPARYAVVSVGSSCLAWASWPLIVVIGFLVIFIAGLLALIAVVSGLLAIGAGIYHKSMPAIVLGVLGLALTGAGAWFVVSALAHF